MPQIAQQDNLFIDVSTLGTFTDDQKKKLVECYKAGTILDVVQRSAVGVSKCISASYADVSTTRTYTSFSAARPCKALPHRKPFPRNLWAIP